MTQPSGRQYYNEKKHNQSLSWESGIPNLDGNLWKIPFIDRIPVHNHNCHHNVVVLDSSATTIWLHKPHFTASYQSITEATTAILNKGTEYLKLP